MESKDLIPMYDLAVIGGGPAGCAAAIISARDRRSVLLLEQGSFPRHKVCGEFVSGEATELLEKLLISTYQSLTERAPRISEARIHALNSEIRTEIAPPAISIQRLDLDWALWQSAIQAGADARENSTVRAIEGEHGASRLPPDTAFRVLTSDGSFRARALINASGRWSFLTGPSTRARARKKKWIGLKGHFLEPLESASVDLYFFPGGYCGVEPVSSLGNGSRGMVINVCAMVKPELARNLGEVFLRHPQLDRRSRSWKPVFEPITTAPLVFHLPEPVAGNLFQVGDAATFVDPFIGDGISLALRSGTMAADCLSSFFAGKSSLKGAAELYSRLYHQQLTPIFRASSRLRRLLDWPELVRTPAFLLLARMPWITDRLVKMTR